MLLVLSNYNLKEKGKKFLVGEMKTIPAPEPVEEQLPSNSSNQTPFGSPRLTVLKSGNSSSDEVS